MSLYTGMPMEVLFVSKADQTALNTFIAEASLFAGTNRLPFIPADYFSVEGKAVELRVQGVFSTTDTPTWLWTHRFHTAAVTATSSVSGTAVGVTAALTSQSGVTNQQWEFVQRITCVTPGTGSTACTVMAAGWVESPGGLAAPYKYAVQPTTPATATWTVTLDQSQKYYPNLTATCGTSSGSNTITAKRIILLGMN